MNRLWMRALAALATIVVAWPAVPVGPVVAKEVGKGSSQPLAAALPGLSMGGDPLTITISPDLNCAVNKVGDQHGEFYNDTACATLIAANGVLYRPALIPAGDNASPFTAFTPVSQTKSGTGTKDDPWRITTVVDAGSGLRVAELDSYVAGDVAYQTDVTIRNQGAGPANIRLYRAADCYLQDSDFGFGRMQPGFSVACVAAATTPNGGFVPGSWVEEWAPISFGAFMFEGYYGDLWAWIGRQDPFTDNRDALDTQMDNSAGLNWSFTLPAGVEATYSNVMRVTDTLACGQQQLDHQTPSGRVIVKYDPRFLWPQKDPNFSARADELALVVQSQAVGSLNEYKALGYPVDQLPNPLVINVRCDFPFFINQGVPGWTESEGTINLRASWMKSEMAGYLGLPGSQRPPAAGTSWANLIDHELAHPFQVLTGGGQVGTVIRLLSGDRANVEGTATAAQDLLSDTDDLAATEYQSFLGLARGFLSNPGQIDQVPDDGHAAYTVAAFFTYLGERFGDQAQQNLEQRVGAMLRAIYAGQHAAGVYEAIGRRESVIAALRDFLVTAYVREAGNKNALPQAYRILDEITAHGQTAGSGSGLPSWGALPTIPAQPPLVSASTPVTLANQTLSAYSGRVYQAGLAAGLESVRVTVTDHRHAFNRWSTVSSDPLALAFVSSAGFTGPGSGSVVLDPALRRVGPAAGASQDYDVTISGKDRLAVVVATGGTPGDYDITIAARTPGLTLDTVVPVTTQDEAGGIELIARATLDGAPAHGVTASSFTASINGTSVPVTAAFELGYTGTYLVFVVPNPLLTAGSYPLTLRYGSAAAQGTVVITNGGGTGTLSSVGQSGTLRTRLTLGGAGSGGTPIETGFVITDVGVGLTDVSVAATVTTPGGLQRRVPLSDTGTAIDSGADDGSYGAYVYGTNAAGTYLVRVDATGTDRSGTPFALSLSDAVTLGAMVDVNGDGVADSLAGQWGAGAADPDGDGASTATELAAGSDPYVADTDGGGEADGTEIAAGRNPRLAGDDLPVSSVGVVADPLDGRLIQVSVGAFDGATPVHLYRVSGGTATDLGVHPGSGEQLTDGPLAAGTYQYVAVGEATNGAQTAPVISSPVEARDDAVAPTVAFYVNNDDYATNQSTVNVTLIDLSKPVTEMRLADSEEALSSAAWIPYQTQTTFALSPGDGVHRLFAQVRDASGLTSGLATGFVVLDTTAPTSSTGALPATTSASSIDVPFSATDSSAGVSAVELWARWRSSSAGTWTPWAVGATATTSPITYGFPYGDGNYEFYTVAIDAAGNREAAPAIADATTTHGTVDTTPPTSQAGPVNATYATNTVAVPFTAFDTGGSGVSSVELWARYRRNEVQPWGPWSLAQSSPTSPFTYTFAGGDGNYEFYTVAIDQAGNREAAPAAADVATRRDVTDDPPDFSLSATATGPCTGQICPLAATQNVVLTGSGTAVDDRSNVTVTWQLWGVRSNGQRTKVFGFKAATPTDGAFDSRLEGYSISDSRSDSGYASYDIEISVSANGVITTRTARIVICRSFTCQTVAF